MTILYIIIAFILGIIASNAFNNISLLRDIWIITHNKHYGGKTNHKPIPSDKENNDYEILRCIISNNGKCYNIQCYNIQCEDCPILRFDEFTSISINENSLTCGNDDYTLSLAKHYAWMYESKYDINKQ